MDLHVFYALRQTPSGQANAGFGVGFEWDLPLLEGYNYTWLTNVAEDPGLGGFADCDTPEISERLAVGDFDALLVYGWNRKCYWQGLLAARMHRLPVIVRLDSHLGGRPWWVSAVKAIPYRLALPRLGHYAFPGARCEAYLAHYGVPRSRRHHVPHMVDTQRIAAGASEARATGATVDERRKLSTSPQAYVFLFVGKFIEVKRPRLLLEAVSHLIRFTPTRSTEICVWFAGDGPLRQELETYVAQEALPVRFLGFVNQTELPRVYASADVLVLPSQSESWGLVVNEAFAAGIPVVTSTGVGCHPDMIIPGVTGWDFQGNDPAALAGALRLAMQRGHSSEALLRKTEAHSFAAGAEALVEALQQIVAD